jgi:ATP-dependent Clp protease protease subunit
VFDGQAIAAAVKRHPANVTAHIDGLAASIATVIALAADRVVMNDNALFMIHDPRVMADGTADDMRSAATLLDRITDTLVSTYVDKSGQSETDVRAAMAAETWYTANEAFHAGFVDQVNHVVGKAAAYYPLDGYGYRNAPNTQPAPAATTEREAMDTDTAVDLSGFATTEDVADLARQIAASAYVAPVAELHPLAKYRNAGEYALAVWEGTAPPMNAAPDQVPADNPGVLPPQWMTDVKRIVNLGRPGITAMGVDPAGPTGLDFAWPYLTTDNTATVAAQSAPKATLNTALISIAKGTASLATYGAYSDIAYQLRDRSAPSYLEAHNRIMLASYANVTDNVFVDALIAGGTASAVDYDLAADTTGALFKAAIFAASVEVETAIGAPANVVLVATNVFLAAGGWSALVPLPYGTQNVAGTADAASLNVNVNGLRVIHDRNLAAGSIIVTHDSAASWIEEGPNFASADIVSKLGMDVAIYGYGVTAIYVPAAVRKITNLP